MLRAELPVQRKRTLKVRTSAAAGLGWRSERLQRHRGAVDGALAGGVERLPGDAGRIGDPALLRLVVAAGRLAFLEDRPVGGLEPAVDLLQLSAVLDLDAEMVD